MPGFEWGWAGEVSAWQTIATGAALVSGLYVSIKLLVRFWPGLKKFIRGVDAVLQLPDFIELTNKNMAEQNKQLAGISHEVNYNNGSSVKDAVDRVELGVAGIYRRLDGLEESVEVLHETDEKLSDQIEEQTQPHIAVVKDDPDLTDELNDSRPTRERNQRKPNKEQ